MRRCLTRPPGGRSEPSDCHPPALTASAAPCKIRLPGTRAPSPTCFLTSEECPLVFTSSPFSCPSHLPPLSPCHSI